MAIRTGYQTGLSLRQQGGSVSYDTQLTQTEIEILLRLYSLSTGPVMSSMNVINGDLISGDDHDKPTFETKRVASTAMGN